LLPAATARFRSLLKEGKAAAESWGSGEDTNLIAAREAEFATLVAATYVDQWQVNAAVHYNEWANLQKSDFAGIVQAFRSLLNALSCANPICGSLLYVVPERGPREALRCTCGVTNINLRRKKIDKLSHLGE
jgi:hypothetical protein